ncbi:MAG: hypothetical protein ACO3QZ_06130, partial [Candidatus Nanopelagicaceae bacterium]
AGTGGGGLTGGTGGGGFTGTGGGGVSISGGGSSTKTIAKANETKQTLIEQVSAANAEKYFGTPATTLGISEVRQRELAADSGVFQRIPSGFDVAAARRGDEVGNVIINVNAPSVVDKEGFTRAVVDALNESASRNGGGGRQLQIL